jgi:hypothetical protein
MVKLLACVLALLVTVTHARFITEIVQSGEMGVEQMNPKGNPSVVSFFAVAQGEMELELENYVLSFGDATLEGGCQQSISKFCTENATWTDGWEKISFKHYPTENSGAAFYIRRAVNLLDDEECFGDSVTRTAINETTIEVSGKLVLSIFTGCEFSTTQSAAFEKIREYPFSITYNIDNATIEGLSYDLISYAYTTKPVRIIDSPAFGTLFEIEVITERIVDYQLTSTVNDTAVPSRLSGAIIQFQELTTGLELAAVSSCKEITGTVCTQTVFFAASDIGYRFSRTNVTGTLALRARVVTPDGKLQNIVDLKAIFDVDSRVETGEEQRTYDVFLTIDGMYYDPVQLYIKDAENSTQITTQSTNCVNINRLDHQRLTVHSIFLYADNPENEEETLLTLLYVPGKISLGSYQVLTDWSAKFCFTFSTLIAMPNSTLIPYYIQVDYGQKEDVNFFAMDRTSTEQSEVATGIMTMQRRSMYNPASFSMSTPSSDEVSDPQLLYFNCPYWNQCYYSGYCMRCSGWDADDVSTGTWVFFGIIMAFVAIGLLALCWCYPSNDTPQK